MTKYTLYTQTQLYMLKLGLRAMNAQEAEVDSDSPEIICAFILDGVAFALLDLELTNDSFNLLVMA